MRNLFVVVFFFNAITAFAQGGTINSFKVLPANPTTSDTIKILVDCTFPSGGCDAMSRSVTQSGNEFNAVANHCVGPLTYICNAKDTFVILPQPLGNYKFIFSLYSGGSAPCNQSFADQDSVFFTVSVATSINNPNEKNSALNAFYRNGKLHIISLSEHFRNADLKVMNISGQVIFSSKNKDKTEIPLELANGIYIVLLENQFGRISCKLMVE